MLSNPGSANGPSDHDFSLLFPDGWSLGAEFGREITISPVSQTEIETNASRWAGSLGN
jgi:hypothetical protein